MTIDELERAAAAFQFVGGLSLWSARVYIARDDGIANLWLQFLIPDSTDPTGKTQQLLRTSQALEPDRLRDEERSPEQYIVDFLCRFFLHEMYESILFRGDRVFDPHVAGAYHPGAL
jgi:hypothetical protein